MIEEIHECIVCHGRFSDAALLANHTCPLATPYIELTVPTPQAKMQISAELLRDLLELPADVEIVSDRGNVELTVRSERIPEGANYVLGIWQKKDDKTEFLRFDKITSHGVVG